MYHFLIIGAIGNTCDFHKFLFFALVSILKPKQQILDLQTHPLGDSTNLFKLDAINKRFNEHANHFSVIISTMLCQYL